MLENFFKLNGRYTTIQSQADFEGILFNNYHLANYLYQPDALQSPGKYFKIKDRSFTNVSFSKTTISGIEFINCKFTDCLFIGCVIIECNFQNCSFTNVNTWKIKISETYVNPSSFAKCILQLSHSNIAVHLFQQLIHNSKTEGQSKFARLAEYQFNKWQDKLTLNKFINKKPYPINFNTFLIQYPINFAFRWMFGYGLRFRNFICTFIAFFLLFFAANHFLWKDYDLEKKDISISSFRSDSTNLSSNFFYTLDTTTKLIDSQFQPKSDFGLAVLSFQSILSFILLTALITILLNKFVK